MRPGTLAIAVVIAGLAMLGTATATWLSAEAPAVEVEGAELPPTVAETAGATAAPASVPAAVVALATSLPLAAAGLAERTAGPAGRRAALGIASAAALAVGVLAAVAVAQSGPTPPPAGEGADAPVVRSAAIGAFGLAAAVVVVATAVAWRAPTHAARSAVGRDEAGRDEAPSAYTVEGVRAEVTDDDEWDLAVADEDRAGGEGA